MARYDLTISDMDDAEFAGVCAALGLDRTDQNDPRQPGEDTGEDTSEDEAAPAETETPKRGRPRKVKAAKPATLPANTAAPTPVPAPREAVVGSIAPAPVATTEAAISPTPAPAAPAAGGEIKMEALIAKARTVGTGPLGQTGLLAVLNAMAAPSLPKVPEQQYPALDALLDAAIAYSGTPAPTKEWFKAVCQTGQYDAATAALTEAVNASMGL